MNFGDRKLDFVDAFRVIGKMLTNDMRIGLIRQTGLDGARYSRPKQSTLLSRERLMSKGSSRGGKRKTKSHKATSIARLYVTHETAENAFKFEPSQDSLRLYVSNVQHNNFYGDHPVTFSEIVQYNSRGQNNVNRNIGNPPLVFPTTTDQVHGMPSWKNAMKVFDRSLKDQLRSIGTSMMKVELHVA